MITRARLTPVLVLASLALAGPALAQTRTDQGPSKPTTAAPPRPTPTSPTPRTVPTMPVDPGGVSGMPSSGSPGQAGSDFGPMGPGGTRTTRPRRSAAPPPDTGSGGDIPYVDPPAAPGYESAADTGPMKTAGGKPVPPTAPHTAAPGAPVSPAAPPTTSAAPAPPTVATPPAVANNVTIVEGPAQLASNPNALWIALGGLAVMLGAAGLGLRHLLAPQLSVRVRMDNGVQSAPRRKDGAA